MLAGCEAYAKTRAACRVGGRPGFEPAAKASIVRHPDRYMDDAGVENVGWTVMRLTGEAEARNLQG